jgi:uncharacterized membrane protein
MSAVEHLESTVRHGVAYVIPVIEAIGACVIAAGVLIAIGSYALALIGVRPVTYEQVRLQLARAIALGIEFQLASDVLGTAVSPTFEQIGRLAAIAGIRTLLNYFLAQEIERAERMEREGLLARVGDEGPVTPPRLRRPLRTRGVRRPTMEVPER